MTSVTGTGEQEDERDVRATKTALKESGDYAPPGGHISGWRDEETDSAMKAVQRRNRIWPDGRMRPGGPTHRIINAERHERLTGFKPKGLGLTGSVGTDASNRAGDTSKVKNALSLLGYVKDGAHETGFGPLSQSAQRMFQQDYHLKNDGIAHPGGPTDTMLSRVAAPLQAASTAKKTTRSAPAKPKVQQVSLSERWEKEKEAVRKGLGQMSTGLLQEMSDAARSSGMKHGPDYLDHFLDGEGMDRQLTKEQARTRNPVKQGEARNRAHFERSFAHPDGNTLKYNQALVSMKDGDEIDLPPDYFDAETDWREHLRNRDMDEHLATGHSQVVTRAHNGFKAVRKGDRVHVYGTVEHRWDDKYDFGERSVLNAVDPTEGYGNVARDAGDFGDAQEYETRSGWLQQFRGEYVLRHGKLHPVNVQWSDVGREADLR